MSRNYIDFISSYCDRWCERCAFTDRCSARASEAAIAMCGGDADAGMELAIGRPATPGAGPPAPHVIDVPEPSPQEMAAFEREEEARDERIDQSPITTQATVVLMLSREWLDRRRDAVMERADAALRDAIDIVGWDSYFIPAKLHRALSGRDEAKTGERVDDHPVQNDWNGSAKVALISIERSHRAWYVIAAATREPEPARLVAECAALQAMVVDAFPNARRFVRPGFDDGGRRRQRWW